MIVKGDRLHLVVSQFPVVNPHRVASHWDETEVKRDVYSDDSYWVDPYWDDYTPSLVGSWKENDWVLVENNRHHHRDHRRRHR